MPTNSLWNCETRQILHELVSSVTDKQWQEFAVYEPELHDPSPFRLKDLRRPTTTEYIGTKALHDYILVLESILIGFVGINSDPYPDPNPEYAERKNKFLDIYLYCAFLYLIAETYYPSATSKRERVLKDIALTIDVTADSALANLLKRIPHGAAQ